MEGDRGRGQASEKQKRAAGSGRAGGEEFRNVKNISLRFSIDSHQDVALVCGCQIRKGEGRKARAEGQAEQRQCAGRHPMTAIRASAGKQPCCPFLSPEGRLAMAPSQ